MLTTLAIAWKILSFVSTIVFWLALLFTAIFGAVQLGPVHLRVDAGDCYQNPRSSGVGRTMDVQVDVSAGCFAIIDAEYVAGYAEHGVFLIIPGEDHRRWSITSGSVRVVADKNAQEVFCQQLDWAKSQGNAITLISGLAKWGSVPCP